jgi:hypothetical protein
MPTPHRISLDRAWTTLPNQSGSLHLQRFFQKPTNLCEQTTVRLRLESQMEIQTAWFNGRKLTGNSTPKPPNANPVDAENSLEFGYDWEVTEALGTRNELVLTWPISDPLPPESPPKFQVWLEIFAP